MSFYLQLPFQHVHAVPGSMERFAAILSDSNFLQPDIVAEVLRQTRAPAPDGNQIIRHVKQYSHKLGQYVSEEVRWCIGVLPTRTNPLDEFNSNTVRDSCSVVSHVLELLDQHLRDGPVELSDLADRAALSVIYAGLLIHLHAKEVIVAQGRGLLDLDYEPVAESYTSDEGFLSVTNAHFQVKEAIRGLEEEGGSLDNASLYIITHPEDRLIRR